MSIVESIKVEKRLSFNHWRYRLLHWCFGVKSPDPDNLFATGLPKFLYTHYCPLFHLTNLIAILSPLILAGKAAGVIAAAAANAIKSVEWGKIRLLPERTPLTETQAKEVEEARKRLRHANEYHKAILVVCMYDEGTTFEKFYDANRHIFDVLTELELRTLFEKYLPEAAAARRRAARRKKALHDQMIFWTNFSRTFVKWFMYAAYAAAVGGILYALYSLIGPAVELAEWLLELCGGGTTWAALLAAAKFLALLAALIFVTIVLARNRTLRPFFAAAAAGLARLSPPLYLVGHFFAWVGSGAAVVAEFAAVFYEENCPPIVLVSRDQAKIDAIAAGEKEED